MTVFAVIITISIVCFLFCIGAHCNAFLGLKKNGKSKYCLIQKNNSLTLSSAIVAGFPLHSRLGYVRDEIAWLVKNKEKQSSPTKFVSIVYCFPCDAFTCSLVDVAWLGLGCRFQFFFSTITTPIIPHRQTTKPTPSCLLLFLTYCRTKPHQ